MVKKARKGKSEKTWTDFKTVLFKEDPGRLERQEHRDALFIDLDSDKRDD